MAVLAGACQGGRPERRQNKSNISSLRRSLLTCNKGEIRVIYIHYGNFEDFKT